MEYVKSRLGRIRDPHLSKDEGWNQSEHTENPHDRENPRRHHFGTRILSYFTNAKRTEFTQQLPNPRFLITIILGIDVQEESVIGRPIKLGIGEHRIRKLRQSIEGQHSKECAEGCQENRQFISDGDEGRQTIKRLAADDVLVIVPVHPTLHDQTRGGTTDPCDQRDPRKDGGFNSQTTIEAVNRKRRKGIDVFVSGIADTRGRSLDRFDSVELGHQSTDFGIF